MFGFFYSIYYALFSGTWTLYTWLETATKAGTFWREATSWVMNCLGGNFDTAQTMTWTLNPMETASLILAFITLFGICAGVFALVKGVFRIFFNRG